MDAVSVQVRASEVLSYAMANSRVPIVHDVTLRNDADEPNLVAINLIVADAQGALSRPCVVRADLAPRGEITLQPSDLLLDPQAMVQVNERRPAWVDVTVTDSDGVELATVRHEVEALAHNQWLCVPPGLAIELLAAHVQPNAPEIHALMAEVSRHLARHTGSDSLEGYQSGPERVDQIVHAVYDCMQARRIGYSEPPASWSDIGQKVRSPHDVLEGRFGTCLDLAVTMAAALEQAGVRPLIWAIEGHAFLAYWRDEFDTGAANLTEASELINLADLGLLATVETTMLCARQEPIPFAKAHNSSRANMRPEVLLGVLDVMAARRSGVAPLPAVRHVDGQTQVFEYRADLSSHHQQPIHADATASPTRVARRVARKEPPPRIAAWKNSLLDLGLRNRLINFTPRHAVELLTPPTTLGRLEDRLQAGRGLTLLSADSFDDIHRLRLGASASASDLPAEVLEQKLVDNATLYTTISADSYDRAMQNLAHKARTVTEETGANNLYLALGTLVWKLDDRELRSPLILVPMQLSAVARRRSAYQIKADEAAQSTPNYCLIEKLRQSFGFSCPDFENPPMDESGIDLGGALTALRSGLAAHGLPFHVEESAFLAILQFAKFRLWKDLDDNWPKVLEQPLARHLALTPNDAFGDPVAARDLDLDSIAETCPIPADASQLTAIGHALAGRTFVLEGPPGTGKSQTIANLLAAGIAHGRSILFVAEKRAALNVVRDRVDKVGLGDFTLDLHDRASRPAGVRRQIQKALDLHVFPDHQGMDAELDVVRSSAGALRRYVGQIHAPNSARLSLYSANTELLVLGEGPALPVPPEVLSSVSAAQVDELGRLMRTLPGIAHPAFPSADAAWGFAAANKLDAVNIPAVAAAARDYDARLAGLPPLERGLVDASVTPAELTAAAGCLATKVAFPAIAQACQTLQWPQMETAAFQGLAEVERLAAQGGWRSNLVSAPVETWAERLRAARTSFFIGRKKRVAAVADEMARFRSAPADVGSLEATIEDARHLLRAVAQATAAVHAALFGQLPPSWTPLDAPAAAWAKDQLADLTRIRSLLTGGSRVGHAAGVLLHQRGPLTPVEVQACEDLASSWASVLTGVGATNESTARWTRDMSFAQRWQATSLRREVSDPAGHSLQRWMAFRQALEPLLQARLVEAHAVLVEGVISADDASVAFKRGLARASMTERMRNTGAEAFSAKAHNQHIARHVTSSGRVRELLKANLADMALARRRYDSNSTAGRLGELKREIQRQRGGLSVRDLMTKYGQLITQAMPCVLVSPDSLARFFPLEPGMFDMVVFDEASQIRVADAVGAIVRGKSAVIVGDSKQMPPTSVAEAQFVIDDAVTDDVVVDEESILAECVSAQLERHSLTWHYRSQDESLIAFSNTRYYDGKLSSFPAPPVAQGPGSGRGVTLVRVNGHFNRTGSARTMRTNQVEADAIVDEVKARFAASDPATIPSIGIVTFNQQQRALIEWLIRDTQDERIIGALDGTDAEGLFIKNLENVQGDERDVVLFSTAFSKNEKGILPLNFGPLTASGGERRLNVAITRARRQIVIFSSFDPEDLRVEQTSSVGIKHLRSYMELARDGAGVLEATGHRAGIVDRHRDDIAAALQARGVPVIVDAGLSDFRIDLELASPEAPDRPHVAVLLDGPAWSARRTVSDRDGMPLAVLREAMKWPVVERVWLPEWLSDRDGVVDRLVDLASDCHVQTPEVPEPDLQSVPEQSTAEASETPSGGEEQELPRRALASAQVTPRRALVDEPGGGTAVAPAPVKAAPVTRVPAVVAPRPRVGSSAPKATGDRTMPAFLPFKPRRVGSREVLDQLPGLQAVDRVGRVLREIIEAEAPIHEERLARLTANCFELTRVTARRREEILTAAGKRRDLEGFYWAESQTPQTYQLYRASTQADRELEHISIVEIANAMRAVAGDAGGISEGELASEVLKKFGLTRRTAKAMARVTQAAKSAVASGRLVARGDFYVAGE